MKEIEKIKDKLKTARPEPWESIPDIDLYMDQVISYMKRQHIGLDLEDEENLTSAMINNYIKSGLLPRAKGKKYNRNHIGYLTAICLLKQVLSVGDAGKLLKTQMEDDTVETFYNNYRTTLDGQFNITADQIDENADEGQLAQLALQLAISSYAQKLACQKILETITRDNEKEN